MRAASGGGQPRSTSSISACKSTLYSLESRFADSLSNPARRNRAQRQATTRAAGCRDARPLPLFRVTSH